MRCFKAFTKTELSPLSGIDILCYYYYQLFPSHIQDLVVPGTVLRKIKTQALTYRVCSLNIG